MDCFPKAYKPPNPFLVAQKFGTPAVLEFDAISYNPPLKVEAIAEREWDLSSPESCVRGAITAGRKGNLEWLTRGYAPDSLAFAKEQAENKETASRLKALYQSILEDYITDTCIYGEYRMVVVASKYKDGKWRNIPYLFKNTSTGWLRTNELQSDELMKLLYLQFFNKQPEINQ